MNWIDDILEEDDDEEFDEDLYGEYEDDLMPYQDYVVDIKESDKTLKKTIKEADKEQTDTYLFHLFKRNPKEWIYFRLANKQKLTEANLAYLYNLIHNFLYDYDLEEDMDPDLFDQYLEDQLFIEDAVSFLITYSHDDQALTVLSYFMDHATEIASRFNSLSVKDLIEFFEHLWLDLLHESKNSTKRKAYLYLKDLKKKLEHDNPLREEVEDLLLTQVYDKESEKEKHDLYKKILKKAKEEETSFRYDRLLAYYLIYLKGQPSYKEEYEKLLKKQEKNSAFLNSVIRIYKGRSDYKNALAFLDKALQLCKPNSNEYTYYLLMKTEVLKGLNKEEERKELLHQILLNDPNSSVTIYREYKKYFSHKAWEEEKKTLLPLLENHRCLPQVYAEEGMMDKVLEIAKKETNIVNFNHYSYLLGKKYPNETLEIYRNLLEKQIDSVNDNFSYDFILDGIEKAKSIQGGTRFISDMFAQWKKDYPDRKNLVTEIERRLKEFEL